MSILWNKYGIVLASVFWSLAIFNVSDSIFPPAELEYDEDETLGGLYELPPHPPPTRTPSRKTTSPEHLPKPPPRGESLYSRVCVPYSQHNLQAHGVNLHVLLFLHLALIHSTINFVVSPLTWFMRKRQAHTCTQC